MSRMVKDVTKFHDYLGAPVRDQPGWPEQARVDLRVDLIDEEINKELLPAIRARNMLKTADGIADSIYVLIGAALEFGIPLDTVWKLVQQANMAKGQGRHSPSCNINKSPRDQERRCDCGVVSYREDGKVAKPPGWQAPDADIAWLVDHSWN